jgi:hypothetical protein
VADHRAGPWANPRPCSSADPRSSRQTRSFSFDPQSRSRPALEPTICSLSIDDNGPRVRRGVEFALSCGRWRCPAPSQCDGPSPRTVAKGSRSSGGTVDHVDHEHAAAYWGRRAVKVTTVTQNRDFKRIVRARMDVCRSDGRYRVVDRAPTRSTWQGQEMPAGEAKWLPELLAGRETGSVTGRGGAR